MTEKPELLQAVALHAHAVRHRRSVPSLLRGHSTPSEALAAVEPRPQEAIERAAASVAAWRVRGTHVSLLSDAPWLSRLRVAPAAPLVVWWRGANAPPAPPFVAVVGSRDADRYAQVVTRALVTAWTEAGLTVVSGGAVGVDCAAHSTCVERGGHTVAVLAGGLEAPVHLDTAPLLRRLAHGEGWLLSELPPHARPERHSFVLRNRLIAALADATVVVSAGAQSGALHTARYARAMGRPVFAVPGDVCYRTHSGCAELIGRGEARLLHHPDVLLAALREQGHPVGQSGGRWPTLGSRAGVLPVEWDPAHTTRHVASAGLATTLALELQDGTPSAGILAALRHGPQHPAAIAERSGLSLAEVQAGLGLLELDGRVARLPGNRFACPERPVAT